MGRWLDFKAFETFFLVCTNFRPAERGGGGWRGELFRVGKATKSSQRGHIPHHKAKETSIASNGSSSRTWPCNWCPPPASIGTILLGHSK